MRKTAAIISLAALVLAACNGGEDETPETLELLTHDSFAGAVTDETFAAFTESTGIEVEVIAAGDAGSLVNQAVLSKDNPLADVLFGVDDTFLSRALDNEIFAEFESSLIDTVPDSLNIDDTGRATPISFGDVCINYDKERYDGLEVPTTLDDLREERYGSQLTVEHPATSSPGLAFMLATIAEYGEDGWLDFWADLRAAGARVAPDWDTAYFSDFSHHGGSSSLVVSYASSPPAEVVLAETPTDEAPTGVIHAGCYRQVEFAGILAGTSYPTAAGQLIDYMLSLEFQEQVPLSWFVFPANSNAALPDEFVAHTVLPESPAQLDPAEIAANRERWIREWVAVMEG